MCIKVRTGKDFPRDLRKQAYKVRCRTIYEIPLCLRSQDRPSAVTYKDLTMIRLIFRAEILIANWIGGV